MPLRILGIDPGSRLCGWGLLDAAGPRMRHVDNGVVVLAENDPMETRLLNLHRELTAIIGEFKPGVAALENVIFVHDPQAAIKLGQARGAALLACAQAGIVCAAYAPTAVKKSVVGTGRADKGQIQSMIRVILGLPEPPQADAADALAVAICHAHHARFFPAALSTWAGKRG